VQSSVPEIRRRHNTTSLSKLFSIQPQVEFDPYQEFTDTPKADKLSVMAVVNPLEQIHLQNDILPIATSCILK